MNEAGLDHIDFAILKELKENARTPLSSIASTLNLSRTAIRKRLKAMEDNSIIAGYHVDLNLQRCIFLQENRYQFLVTFQIPSGLRQPLISELRASAFQISMLDTTDSKNQYTIFTVTSHETLKAYLHSLSHKLPELEHISAHSLRNITDLTNTEV